MNNRQIFLILLALVIIVTGVFVYNLFQRVERRRVVDAEWLADHLKEVKIIAVGSDQSFFNKGYIPNSFFISYQDLIDKNSSIQGLVLSAENFELLMRRLGVSEETNILLYDNQSGLFAARTYWTFYYYGHTNLLFLDGGLSSWIKQGFPITTTVTSSSPSNYKLSHLNHQILATLTDVRAHIYDPNVVIIDARSEQEYSEGHVPSAINIEWSSTLTSEGTFKDAMELKNLFIQHGVTPEKTIITYCTTGVRGAHMWFVLSQILKYPTVMLYDGSWVEWVAASQPIER